MPTVSVPSLPVDMRSRCVGNFARDLSDEYFQMGYTEKAAFPVTIGRNYRVYGMCIFHNALLFLVHSDNDLPDWLPAVLFEVTDNALPSNWKFSLQDGDRSAVWGFEELALDSNFFDRLSEHEAAALAVFRKRKSIIDGMS